MAAMRSTWTDSRLDDLNGRVSDLGSEVRELRGEIGDLKRTLLQVGGGMAGAMLVGFMGLIATQL
ncbi:MAG: hypothetical protein AB7T48_04615 [Solirubrobacterales bacterium]